MGISRDDIEHVAFLARLGLTEDEKVTLQEQLSSILEHMRTINELDTSQIPPTAQVIPLRNVMRPDVPQTSLSVDQVLQNAPDREGAFFRVPHILE